VQPIVIRREDQSPHERRAPLTPEDLRQLRAQGLEVAVQPSPQRAFSDEEYRAAGASLAPDLAPYPIVLGVREVPPEQLAAGKTYVIFSHTIKGQPQNMPLLRRLLELGCTLLDYEKIADDQAHRLVYFGRFAGLAGAVGSLWALGQRLLLEGIETPFARLQPAHRYGSLEEAFAAVEAVGAALAEEGVPRALRPLVIGLTGYGKVSSGAQEMIDRLRPRALRPDELAGLRGDEPGLAKVVFREEEMVEPLAGRSRFLLEDYYVCPEGYRACFERYLPHLTLLLNCVYWEPRYPRLVTAAGLRALHGAEDTPRLRVIGDLSCDVAGSVEVTLRTTSPERPVFVYDPETGEARDGFAGRGPVILAVDTLPAELPREASQSFSAALAPLLPALAAADLSGSLEQSGLPAPLRRATIALRGALTPSFAHLARHL